jgi:hypothetical protein
MLHGWHHSSLEVNILMLGGDGTAPELTFSSLAPRPVLSVKRGITVNSSVFCSLDSHSLQKKIPQQFSEATLGGARER